MSIRIKLKGYDIVVLPLEGKVLGRPRKDGTRKEIGTCKTKKGYHHLNQKSYPDILRARTIWIAVNGPIPDGMQINHINHNTSDDRITNLELVTAQQNSAYTRKRSNTKTRYKGVYPSSRNTFKVEIRCGASTVYVGSFATEEEAARAYDAAAREWFGRHAVLNFPDEVSNG